MKIDYEAVLVDLKRIRDAADSAIIAIEESIVKPRGRSLQQEEQRRSFAYGNAKLANEDVTREGIDRAADAMNATEAPRGVGETA